MAIVREHGAELVGVGVLGDRSGGQAQFGVKALLRENMQAFAPEDCPLCNQGIPLVKPGSRSGV